MNSKIRYKWDIPEEFHYDTWIAERTNKLLEEYKENYENFFIWSSFFDPHPPYLVCEPWASMYNPNDITVTSVVEGEHKDSPPHIQMTQMENVDFSEYRETGYEIHGMSRNHLVPKEQLAKDIVVYYSMISMMDKYIGNILDKLDELGLAIIQ